MLFTFVAGIHALEIGFQLVVKDINGPRSMQLVQFEVPNFNSQNFSQIILGNIFQTLPQKLTEIPSSCSRMPGVLSGMQTILLGCGSLRAPIYDMRGTIDLEGFGCIVLKKVFAGLRILKISILF